MANCPTGKRRFASQSLAEDALLEAHIVYQYREGQGPVGVYTCHECGDFHFTSQGPVNDRLREARATGQLQRLQQAQRWNKWK